jgi:putative ATPase
MPEEPSLFATEPARPATASATPREAEDAARAPGTPLAERMRPRSLDEVAGQEHLLAPGAALRSLADSGRLPSLVLWGPPGCGKTTLAKLLAEGAGLHLCALSAVMAGVKEIREVVEQAREWRRAGRRTALFLDEIHRLNRAQQDALLPHAESGAVTLIGATTENPSFEVIAPLLSRCRVFTLRRLGAETLAALVRRATGDTLRGLGTSGAELTDEVALAIAHAADGDARRALGLLEAAVSIHLNRAAQGPLSADAVREAAGSQLLFYDRDREEHYNLISAFIKSLRASDPDAALYYAARMLDAGEDPLFLARRMLIFASEDVGNADPAALPLALAAYQAFERLGLPEGRIPLAQALTYLACAPKSNASHAALGRASAAASERGSLPVPMHLRNAPTGLMQGLGYGQGYEYPHDAPEQFVARANLPDALRDLRFYEPKNVGAEAEIAARLAGWRAKREP